MAEIVICRPLCELDALTTEQCTTNQAHLQQDGMFMKLTMARASTKHAWINYNKLGKIANHVKKLPEIFYSKSRERLRHAMALHNCKQLQERINYNCSYKTSLLNITKICMDLSVASSLHGNKITADKDLEKSPSPWNQKHYGAYFACLCLSPQRSQKYMTYTLVKMAWHKTKHM